MSVAAKDHPAIAGLPLVLGGNVFGWTADRHASFAVLDRFFKAGGRMIDTAQGYSVWAEGHVGGESETVIGQWIESRDVRGEVRIATKTNMFGEKGGLAPERIAAELEKSLERLRTDYVDLYYAHQDEDGTPQDEVAEGFDALIRAGKVKEAGASNYTAERLRKIVEIADKAGLTPFTVLQTSTTWSNARLTARICSACASSGASRCCPGSDWPPAFSPASTARARTLSGSIAVRASSAFSTRA